MYIYIYIYMHTVRIRKNDNSHIWHSHEQTTASQSHAQHAQRLGETRSKRSEGSTTWRLGVRMLRLVHGWPASRVEGIIYVVRGPSLYEITKSVKMLLRFFVYVIYQYCQYGSDIM